MQKERGTKRSLTAMSGGTDKLCLSVFQEQRKILRHYLRPASLPL